MSAASQSGSVLHCRSLSYREISLLSEFSYSKESKKTSAYTLSRFCPQQPCTFHSGPHPQPLDKSLEHPNVFLKNMFSKNNKTTKQHYHSKTTLA
jgi:hypothetical protein